MNPMHNCGDNVAYEVPGMAFLKLSVRHVASSDTAHSLALLPVQ